MEAQQILNDLISTNSVFGNEAELANWLKRFLQQQGFTTRTQNVKPQRYNVLANRGSGTAKLMCYGHIDTVPVYDGWLTDPFTLTSSGDKLYGLGTCDMKGGIAALLVALTKIPRDLPIKVLFAVDEENASAGAWATVNQNQDWLKGITHILSVEPGDGAQAMGGAHTITLGRRGRALFRVSIHGFSARGAHSERGINAINIATKFIDAVNSWPVIEHPRLGRGSQYVSSINADSSGLSIPDNCELEIERHLVIPEDIGGCLQEFRNVASDILKNLDGTDEVLNLAKIDVSVVSRENPYMLPYEVSSDDPIVRKVVRILKTKGKISIGYGQSVADENVFASQVISPVVIGPMGGNMHSPNEWVSKKSLQQCAEVYTEIIPAIIKSE